MENPNKHMQVEIISATEKDPTLAAALLIFTKSTRLQMDGANLESVQYKCSTDPDWMMAELDYMSKTIRSSWEFLDITFAVKNVSRAAAQQITRTRFTPIDGDLFGSYAMQSQRVTDMSEATWHNPIRDNAKDDEEGEYNFDCAVEQAMGEYKHLVEGGMSLEDARGVLPVNLHCSLVAKYNLRMLADLLQARASYRAQGEFNQLAAEMKRQLIAMWPWAEMFLRPRNELAALAMEDFKTALRDLAHKHGIAPGDRHLHDAMIKLAKVDDLLQGNK